MKGKYQNGWLMKGRNITMDGQFAWKRTEDIEIDFMDLLRRLCMQWKKAVIFAVVFAAVSGGCGWVQNRNSQQERVSETAGTEKMEELTKTEKQEVADAVQLEHEMEGLEAYLEDSVLMQLDPYHKNRVILLYRISHAKRQDLPVITESYLNFMINGGAVQQLAESGSCWKQMDKSCLAELISAYQKTYSLPYQEILNEMDNDKAIVDALFYTEVTGKNKQLAEQLAQDLHHVLKTYSAEIKKNTGGHSLVLVNSVSGVTADSGLQAQQHDKKALLSSGRTSLKAMTDVFNKNQMAAYKKAAGIKSSDEDKEAEEIAELDGSRKHVLKYVLLGFAGGVFVYCGLFACWYLFCDTVKSTQEMKKIYSFPVYGAIPMKNSDAFKQANIQLQNRIRLACKQKGITRICAAAGFSCSAYERECLHDMEQNLREFQIDMSVLENDGADTDAWMNLAEAGNVLMVCRLGTTTRRMIDDEMAFYQDNGILVAGAIVFT